MKNVLALATFVFVPAVVFAASFEGKVKLKMSSSGSKPQEIVYNIKDDKIRLELPGQSAMGGLILDPKTRETTIVMDEQKMYMTISAADVPAAGAAGEADEGKLEKTSETEKILGYTATKYLATHKDSKTELWLAEGLGAFMAFSNPNPMAGARRGNGGAGPQPWERALAGKELFPLRVVGRDNAGKETFRMEVTAIEKQKLPASMFAPPEGYQKFEMSGMMQGLMPKMGR